MSGALAIFHHCARNEDCKDSKDCLQPPLLLSASGEWTKRLPTEPDNFYNQGYKNTGLGASTTCSGDTAEKRSPLLHGVPEASS